MLKGETEVAAALGLVVGLFRQPLGIAAAIGFTLTMIGAGGHHVQAGDYANPETWGNAMAAVVLIPASVPTAATLTPTM